MPLACIPYDGLQCSHFVLERLGRASFPLHPLLQGYTWGSLWTDVEGFADIILDCMTKVPGRGRFLDKHLSLKATRT
eukprot:1160053-Pelagomonas_calceolata.AAC.4